MHFTKPARRWQKTACPYYLFNRIREGREVAVQRMVILLIPLFVHCKLNYETYKKRHAISEPTSNIGHVPSHVTCCSNRDLGALM